MDKIGIFTINSLRTFEGMYDNSCENPTIRDYVRYLSEKFRDGGYFRDQESMLMELSIGPQKIGFTDVRNSLRDLANYMNRQPSISGAFGITYLARFAERYGFEVVDSAMPPEQLSTGSSAHILKSPRFLESFSKIKLNGGIKRKFIKKVGGAAIAVRPVAISREELMMRYRYSK